MATAQELQAWRAQALKAGATQDVAAIDAELFKLQPSPTVDAPRAPAAPLDDLAPLAEAYRDKQHAIAQKAPQDVLDAIDAHIHAFTRKMQAADVGRTLESMGAGGQFLAGAGRGLTSATERIGELGQELFDPNRTTPYGPGPELAKQVAARKEREAETAPLTQSLSGELGNMAGEAAATAPIALAVPAGAGPVLGGALVGAGTGAVLGDPGERLKSAALMGGAGGVLGAAGKAAMTPVRGVVQPTESAQLLRAAGVKGMTAGQASPMGTVAHFEQAAESSPLGATVKAARGELPYNLETKFLEQAAPEGFSGDLSRSVATPDRLQTLRNAIGAGYDAILDARPVPKNAVARDVARTALNQGEALLTPAERDSTFKWLGQQLGKLEGKNTLETLHHIRSEVRKKSFGLRNTSPEIASHLGEVEDVLTGHIDSALKAHMDPEASAKLAALDSNYRTLKTLENAAAYEPAEGSATITPDRLLRELKSGSTKSAFARGSGGDLRELASAGKKVLSPPRPVTGALSGVLQAIPLLGSWGPGISGLASSRLPNAFLGETLPQRILQKTLGQPVVQGALGQGARAGAADLLLGNSSEMTPEQKAQILLQTLGQK